MKGTLRGGGGGGGLRPCAPRVHGRRGTLGRRRRLPSSGLLSAADPFQREMQQVLVGFQEEFVGEAAQPDDDDFVASLPAGLVRWWGRVGACDVTGAGLCRALCMRVCGSRAVQAEGIEPAPSWHEPGDSTTDTAPTTTHHRHTATDGT